MIFSVFSDIKKPPGLSIDTFSYVNQEKYKQFIFLRVFYLTFSFIYSKLTVFAGNISYSLKANSTDLNLLQERFSVSRGYFTGN